MCVCVCEGERERERYASIACWLSVLKVVGLCVRERERDFSMLLNSVMYKMC